jgi:GT2 family glycosyltransferase
MFMGFVLDVANLSQRFVVELLVDGRPLRSVHATDYLAALAAAAIGDGCYGFCFSLDAQLLSNAEIVEARIANCGIRVGEPVVMNALSIGHPGLKSSGGLQWLGGVRFSGWVREGYEGVIDIQVDGEQVTQVRASGWCHVGEAETTRAARAFHVHLPSRFADGAVHRLAAIDATGDHLGGGPVPFVVLTDDLSVTRQASSLMESEDLRAAILRQLVPMSVPFAAYDSWQARLPRVPAIDCPLKAAVIVVGTGEFDDTLASLDAQTHSDWVAVSLPDTGSYAGLDCDGARRFLAGEAAEAEFVVFALSGAILAPDAILRIADALKRDPDIVAVYGDVEIAAEDGSVWPLAFPAFDYERMLEQGYCSHVFALRSSTAERALAKGVPNLYRLFNTLLDHGMETAEQIAHLPGAVAVLPRLDLGAASEALAAATRAHLEHRRVEARVDAGNAAVLPAARISRSRGNGSVTIVIPTRNKRALLETCLGSLRPALEKRNCEIIVVDNGSSERDTLDYLESIDGVAAKVMRIEGDFNFARLNNMAAAAAEGEFLCLLNNDVQALDGNWLDEMLGRMSGPGVGAVGARLLWPSGIVQHGGVVLGANFAATHAFNDRMDGDAGYGDLLRVAHECSAVTAACLLTRRTDYLDLGGMDEFRFPVNFNDVDYCLKLRAAGRRVVFTPHAKLLHLESASRGSDKHVDRKARLDRELRNLRAKWADVLMDDPFYSPVLSLDPIPFSALAWPLRSMECRRLKRPTPVHVPPGF